VGAGVGSCVGGGAGANEGVSGATVDAGVGRGVVGRTGVAVIGVNGGAVGEGVGPGVVETMGAGTVLVAPPTAGTCQRDTRKPILGSISTAYKGKLTLLAATWKRNSPGSSFCDKLPSSSPPLKAQ